MSQTPPNDKWASCPNYSDAQIQQRPWPSVISSLTRHRPCSSDETNVERLYEAESNGQGARRDEYEQPVLDLVIILCAVYL